MDKTPQCIQLAFGYVEMLPVGQHHQPTLPGGTIQLRADGIFVTLNNPPCRVDGVTFCQRAHYQFKLFRLRFQTKVSRSVGHCNPPATGLTQRLFCP